MPGVRIQAARDEIRPTSDQASRVRDLPPNCPITPQAHRVLDQDGHPHVEVLRVWPEPAAWVHTPDDGWKPWRPEVHVQWADSPAEDNEYPGADNIGWDVPLLPLLQAIPVEVRAAVAPLDDPHCWLTLRLLHAVPAALDVVLATPCLGGLLAQHVDDTDDRDAACEALRAALRRPRKHLLPLAGLPERTALLRVLTRVEPRALSIPGPAMIRQVLTSEERRVVKLLHHLPFIRADVACVLAYPDLLPLASFSLLADPDDCIAFGVHCFLNRVDAARDRRLVPTTPARFRSRRELLEFDEARRRLECWSPTTYSEPFEVPASEATVLPGEPQVELRPVLAADEMHQVSLEDRLCIASARRYPLQAIAGEGAMFTAIWRDGGEEQRATVWLGTSLAGYYVDQVRLRFNKAPPEWLLSRLEPWIEEVNRVCAAPVELLSSAKPDPQRCLPLTWSSSPLDAPSHPERGSAVERPADLGYEDHWLVAG